MTTFQASRSKHQTQDTKHSIVWVLIATASVMIGASPARAQTASARQAAELDAAAERWAKALRDAKSPFEFQRVAEEALMKMDAAARVARFEAANSLGLTAVSAASKSQNPPLRQEAAARKKELDDFRQAWETAIKNRTRADAEANVVLGKHLCFVKGEWDIGLGKLMMCEDETLKQLAWKTSLVKDDPAEQVALGDAWWDEATKTSGKPKSEFQSGAAYLYSQALPKLQPPQSNLIEKRLEEAARGIGRSRILPSVFEVPLTDLIVIRMRRIPAGRAIIGSPVAERGHTPYEEQKTVVIPRPFYMSVTEITQSQFPVLARLGNPSDTVGNDLPVYGVRYERAMLFIDALNRLPIGKQYRFRLPTSAEWEYACRAGTTTAYYFGNDPARLNDFAWHSGNSGGEPHPVAQLMPNAWGLYDMLGNVEEWTNDKFVPRMPGGNASNDDRLIVRGGSFSSPSHRCRSAMVDSVQRDAAAAEVGIRLVCDPYIALPGTGAK